MGTGGDLRDARALARRCERALFAAARAHGAGTRQLVRAAARRFVRRNRRDASYLAWVLRSASACSTLAIALLGLVAEPARGETPPFREHVGAANPFAGVDVGDYSAPAFGDLDGDGDLDALVGEFQGTLLYFLNTGSATSPAFVQQTGSANPLTGQNVGSRPEPTLVDLDADRDLDLVAGEDAGLFVFYENTGSATSPAFVSRTGTDDPLDGQDVGSRAAPAFGDLDGDGDADLVAGAAGTTLHYFENTGSATSPAFAQATGAANPLDGHWTGAPFSFGDVDRDGDLDVFGPILLLENTGTAASPHFAERTGSANPIDGLSVGDWSSTALGDLDGDSDPDLLAGQGDGTLRHYENPLGRLIARTGAENPLAGQDAGNYAKPAFGDLDGDGDLDLVSGNGAAQFAYYENAGTATSPAFVPRTGVANPLDGQDISSRSSPALGDLDEDGDLDLVAGNIYGLFHYFENTGSGASPAFVEHTGAANPLDGQDTGFDAAPTLGDVDGDGDLDLVAGTRLGTFLYCENTGSAASPAFVPRSGAANPLNGEDVGVSPSPSLVDVDGDGDLDLVTTPMSAAPILPFYEIGFYENTGSASAPAFERRTGAANPFTVLVNGMTLWAPALADLERDGDLDVIVGTTAGTFAYYESFLAQTPQASAITGPADPLGGLDAGALAAPALADLDRDGDADLVVGESSGALLHYANTGDAASPAFVELTGPANPLDGRDVGDEAKPAFADLDGDGDLDLVAGSLTGDFAWFENTGDAVTPLFAALVANPFGLGDVGSNSAPALGDLDGDGDPDLVAGGYYGGLAYFENTGIATSPAFVERSGSANPFTGIDPIYYSTPTLADFDADGDLDLVSGAEHGRLFYFRNTGSATAPAFAPHADPNLAGVDVGDHSAPAAGNLNGDGRPDLVTGTLAGTFRVHYFSEPARSWLIAAGSALLALLRRRRS